MDLHSVSSEECRTVGGEAVAHEAFKQLGFQEILSAPGFEKHQRQQAELLIVGRVLRPGSERETARWARETSALGELLNADFRNLLNNSLYRISDRLCGNSSRIEAQLSENESQYFGLKEKIILYDLTYTFSGIRPSPGFTRSMLPEKGRWRTPSNGRLKSLIKPIYGFRAVITCARTERISAKKSSGSCMSC